MDKLLNKIHLMDCMDLMAELEDNSIDLAIVDPPYGIGQTWSKSRSDQFYSHRPDYLNSKIPPGLYFKELKRVSKNQIIWGGNYFTEYLSPTNSWIFWDKGRDANKTFMSEGELAWTSFKKVMRKVKVKWDGGKKGPETGITKIHPFQKPINLYRWLLLNYTPGPGSIILDTHSGSGSCAIACIEEKFNFIACEIDPDYHKASLERLQPYFDQGRLF